MSGYDARHRAPHDDVLRSQAALVGDVLDEAAAWDRAGLGAEAIERIARSTAGVLTARVGDADEDVAALAGVASALDRLGAADRASASAGAFGRADAALAGSGGGSVGPIARLGFGSWRLAAAIGVATAGLVAGAWLSAPAPGAAGGGALASWAPAVDDFLLENAAGAPGWGDLAQAGATELEEFREDAYLAAEIVSDPWAEIDWMFDGAM